MPVVPVVSVVPLVSVVPEVPLVSVVPEVPLVSVVSLVSLVPVSLVMMHCFQIWTSCILSGDCKVNKWHDCSSCKISSVEFGNGTS